MPDSIVFRRKPVLVLGASGFIGTHVVAALSANSAYQPIAASRQPNHGGVALDATNAAAMRDAISGVDYVVNCIAGSNEAMVRSTQALCDAARAKSPERIVHLSSMAAYGAATGSVREDHPAVDPVSGYGRAKLACEDIIRKYGRDGGDAVVLRPTCVFGPGSEQWTTRIARLLRAHRAGDLGAAGDGCCNLAFIDDVVAGIVNALVAPDVADRAFNVSSSSELTWNEFLVRFGKALGMTPINRISRRTLKLETKVMAPAFRIAGKVLRGRAPEAITPSLASLWAQDIRIDSSAAVAALGLPQTAPDAMIAASVLWLRDGSPPVSRLEFA